MTLLLKKYLLDIEGNLYSFKNKESLEKYIISPDHSPKEETQNSIILYNDELTYEIPAEIARSHIIGQRKLAEHLKEISRISIEELKDEELSEIAPAIYKLCENELLLLCEAEESEDVSLYQVAIKKSYLKAGTKTSAVKRAAVKKAKVRGVKEEVKRSMVKTSPPYKNQDAFLPRTDGEHKEANFFSSIKDLAKGWAGNKFGQMKAGLKEGQKGINGGGGWGSDSSTASKVFDGAGSDSSAAGKVFDGAGTAAGVLENISDGLQNIRSSKMSNVGKGLSWKGTHHLEDKTSKALGNLTNKNYSNISTVMGGASVIFGAVSKTLDDGVLSLQDKFNIGADMAGFVAGGLIGGPPGAIIGGTISGIFQVETAYAPGVDGGSQDNKLRY